MITTIFTGAFMLVNKFEEERPLTGHDKHSLQQDPTQNSSNTASESEVSNRS